MQNVEINVEKNHGLDLTEMKVLAENELIDVSGGQLTLTLWDIIKSVINGTTGHPLV